jgi:ABC-type spermidine/putrescine transport system permease subunit I
MRGPALARALLSGLPVLPALLVVALAYLLPLAWLVPMSLQDTDRSWTGLANYGRALDDPLFLTIAGRTFRVAFLTAAACVLLAYPIAWQLSRIPRRWFPYLAAVIAIPLLTSTIVRSEAWVFLLLPDGLVNEVLGLIPGMPRLSLLRSEAGVLLAMIQVLLPIALLPLLAAFYDLDRDLLAAARGLGATPRHTWTEVIIPLTAPAAATSAALTFLLALGFWVTPSIVGGHQSTLIAQLISQQASLLLDVQYASTLAVILIGTVASVAGAVWVLSRVARRMGAA